MARPINAAKGLAKIIAYLAACIVPGLLIDTLFHFIFGDSLLDSHYDIGFGTLLRSLLWTIVVIIVLFIVALTASKGEDNWKFKKIKDKYHVVIMNKARVKWNEALNRTERGKYLWIKRWITPDKLLEILKENKVILFSLSNYLKRLYIFYVKMDQVTAAERVSKQMMGYVGHHTDKQGLIDEIYACRNGGIISRGAQRNEVGWFKQYIEFCDVMNEISQFLTKYILHVSRPEPNKSFTSFQNQSIVLQGKLKTVLAKIRTSMELLNERAQAFGAHQTIDAWRYLVLDQCNPCGNFEHQYKFINENGTVFYTGVYELGRLVETTGTRNRQLEVNMYGEVLEDIHHNKEHDDNIIPIRRVKDPRKINDYPNPMLSFQYILRDWEAFIRQLRFGEFSYYSRSIFDYKGALSAKKQDKNRLGRLQFFEVIDNGHRLDDKNIPNSIGYKGVKTPAFDRRALVAPGKLEYVGRKIFDQLMQDIKRNNIKSNWPSICSLGLSMYMPAVAIRDVNDITELQNSLNRFLRDTSATVEKPTDAKKAMGSLGETVAKRGGQ